MVRGGKAKLEVRFYRAASGREPVREWLKSLGKDEKAVIGSDIQAVQWRWPISKPLVDGLGKGLYEVRSTVNDIEYRVLFCIADEIMVLLHGFVKKTRTAPKQLEIGRERMKKTRGRLKMHKNIGSKLADFLEEEGLKDDVDLLTVKKVMAAEIEARMEKQRIGITALAKKMSTSRSQVLRILDGEDTGISFKTVSDVARALESNLIELITITSARARALRSTATPKKRPPKAKAKRPRRVAHVD